MFFGGEPGAPLPSVDPFATAKHTKGNAAGVKTAHPAMRVISRSKFQRIADIPELYSALFGGKSTGNPPEELELDGEDPPMKTICSSDPALPHATVSSRARAHILFFSTQQNQMNPVAGYNYTASP